MCRCLAWLFRGQQIGAGKIDDRWCARVAAYAGGCLAKQSGDDDAGRYGDQHCGCEKARQRDRQIQHQGQIAHRRHEEFHSHRFAVTRYSLADERDYATLPDGGFHQSHPGGGEFDRLQCAGAADAALPRGRGIENLLPGLDRDAWTGAEHHYPELRGHALLRADRLQKTVPDLDRFVRHMQAAHRELLELVREPRETPKVEATSADKAASSKGKKIGKKPVAQKPAVTTRLAKKPAAKNSPLVTKRKVTNLKSIAAPRAKKLKATQKNA